MTTEIQGLKYPEYSFIKTTNSFTATTDYYGVVYTVSGATQTECEAQLADKVNKQNRKGAMLIIGILIVLLLIVAGIVGAVMHPESSASNSSASNSSGNMDRHFTQAELADIARIHAKIDWDIAHGRAIAAQLQTERGAAMEMAGAAITDQMKPYADDAVRLTDELKSKYGIDETGD